MELSDDPPLGDWKIKVRTSNGMAYEKMFSVEKYVLPKFEVTIKPASFVTNKDDIQVLVKAKLVLRENNVFDILSDEVTPPPPAGTRGAEICSSDRYAGQ